MPTLAAGLHGNGARCIAQGALHPTASNSPHLRMSAPVELGHSRASSSNLWGVGPGGMLQRRRGVQHPPGAAATARDGLQGSKHPAIALSFTSGRQLRVQRAGLQVQLLCAPDVPLNVHRSRVDLEDLQRVGWARTGCFC